MAQKESPARARVGEETGQVSCSKVSAEEGIVGNGGHSVPEEVGLAVRGEVEGRLWVLGCGNGGRIGLRGPPAGRVAVGRRAEARGS